MLDKRQYNDNILYHDMPLEDQHEWFGYSRNKFLHNIDTFYYSVKIIELSNVARKEGLLSLEEAATDLEEPFLKREFF